MLKNKVKFKVLLSILCSIIINNVYSSKPTSREQKISEQIKQTEIFPKGLPEMIAGYARTPRTIHLHLLNPDLKGTAQNMYFGNIYDHQIIDKLTTQYPSLKNEERIMAGVYINPHVQIQPAPIGNHLTVTKYENKSLSEKMVIPRVVKTLENTITKLRFIDFDLNYKGNSYFFRAHMDNMDNPILKTGWNYSLKLIEDVSKAECGKKSDREMLIEPRDNPKNVAICIEKLS